MLSHRRLNSDHQVIGQALGDLLRHAGRRTIDIGSLSQARWRLSRLLLPHFNKIDCALHPLLRRSNDAAAIAASQRFQHLYGLMSQDFCDYMRRWNMDAILTDQTCFADDTRRMAAAITDRLAAQEKQLYRHIPADPSSCMVDATARRA